MSDTPPRSFPHPRSSSDADASPVSGEESVSEPTVSTDAPAETTPLTDEQLTALPDAHRERIKHLHARVEQAARVIEMLQEENARLRKRVQTLERRPDVPDEHALLTFEERPEVLRERIERFIEAIDRYLGTDASAEEGIGSAVEEDPGAEPG